MWRDSMICSLIFSCRSNNPVFWSPFLELRFSQFLVHAALQLWILEFNPHILQRLLISFYSVSVPLVLTYQSSLQHLLWCPIVLLPVTRSPNCQVASHDPLENHFELLVWGRVAEWVDGGVGVTQEVGEHEHVNVDAVRTEAERRRQVYITVRLDWKIFSKLNKSEKIIVFNFDSERRSNL